MDRQITNEDVFCIESRKTNFSEGERLHAEHMLRGSRRAVPDVKFSRFRIPDVVCWIPDNGSRIRKN